MRRGSDTPGQAEVRPGSDTPGQAAVRCGSDTPDQPACLDRHAVRRGSYTLGQHAWLVRSTIRCGCDTFGRPVYLDRPELWSASAHRGGIGRKSRGVGEPAGDEVAGSGRDRLGGEGGEVFWRVDVEAEAGQREDVRREAARARGTEVALERGLA